ncbi:MAG: hypothetical protein IJ986_07850, partial [Bacteroidales bacterium]|nr:hypothetical protein [Bacteroidales bacterium]
GRQMEKVKKRILSFIVSLAMVLTTIMPNMAVVVLVVWECQLKPKLLEQTMERIEVKLQDYFLRTFGPKSLKYILLPDEDVPMAADAHVEYGANLDDIET